VLLKTNNNSSNHRLTFLIMNVVLGILALRLGAVNSEVSVSFSSPTNMLGFYIYYIRYKPNSHAGLKSITELPATETTSTTTTAAAVTLALWGG